jgi:hypothetical protein
MIARRQIIFDDDAGFHLLRPSANQPREILNFA